MNESNPAWQFFAALQGEADSRLIDRTLARDEALDAVLDDVVTDPTLKREVLSNRFHSLCRNRLSKQLHRRAIDIRRFRSTHRQGGVDLSSVLPTTSVPSAFDQVAYAQLRQLLRTVLPEEELRILLEIADGDSYSDIALAHHKTVASVKAKVFRVRNRLRNSQIAATLLNWPRR